VTALFKFYLSKFKKRAGTKTKISENGLSKKIGHIHFAEGIMGVPRGAALWPSESRRRQIGCSSMLPAGGKGTDLTVIFF
jgi:hypothetical protein